MLIYPADMRTHVRKRAYLGGDTMADHAPAEPSNWCPGWEGSIGPGRGSYSNVHVYARSIHSGAGNCVCGSDLGDWIHVQAAPGVPVPPSHRRGSCPQRYRPAYERLGLSGER